MNYEINYEINNYEIMKEESNWRHESQNTQTRPQS